MPLGGDCAATRRHPAIEYAQPCGGIGAEREAVTSAKLLRHFFENRRAAKTNAMMGDELRDMARMLLRRASEYYDRSSALLDSAGDYAKQWAAARAEEDEQWPPGLEDEIRAALEARDDAGTT